MNVIGIKLAGLVFTLIVGTLSHFVYQWSGKNPVVGLVTAVNESTWEYLKLLFFPVFLSGIVECFLLYQECPNYIMAQTAGILAGMLTAVALFYTYSGVLGFHFLAVEILTFVIGALAGFGVSLYLLKGKIFFSLVYTVTGGLILEAIMLLFWLYPVSATNWLISRFSDRILWPPKIKHQKTSLPVPRQRRFCFYGTHWICQ